MAEDMLNMICCNPQCCYHIHGFPVPKNIVISCPLCGSILVMSKHWLEKIYEDDSIWIDEENKWPCIISFEYARLKSLCKKRDSYGVLLCLKDNFEVILKFETLIVYAGAAEMMDSVFEKETIALITTPNLSLGSWKELAIRIVNNLEKDNKSLPFNTPLKLLVSLYDDYTIVNWRNEKIGHGAMGFEEDEDFRQDIEEKIRVLYDILNSLNSYLVNQRLIMICNGEKNELIGKERARDLDCEGDVYLSTVEDKQENTVIKLTPFINISKNEKNKYGVYFFDNQKKTTLSVFQAYADGIDSRRRDSYFERLRLFLNKSTISLGVEADNPNKTVDEYRELDIPYVVEDYISQPYIIKWLKGCLEKYSKGVFMLQMERGMGKSVFTEKLNLLFDSPIVLSNDLDVRTYHLNRIQSGGQNDMFTYIEWLWDHDYNGKRYMGIKHISDLKNEGKSSSQALVGYLENVLKSRSLSTKAKRILMVFDGIDEVIDQEIYSYFNEKQELPEGVYILYTSRNPETEKLDSSISNLINNIETDDMLFVNKESDSNIDFLKRYVLTTKLSNLQGDKLELLIRKASYRILELKLLCHLIENGMILKEELDTHSFVSKYIEMMGRRYGYKDYYKIKELLVIISLLGNKENLTIRAISQLISDNVLNLRLVGMLADLTPLFNVERNEMGNCFRMANPDVASELVEMITERDFIISNLLEIAFASMKEEDIPEDYSGEEIVCQHIYDLSLMHSKGVEIFENNYLEIVKHFCEKYSELEHIHKINIYYKLCYQYYILFSNRFGYNYPESISIKNCLSDILERLGRRKEAIDNSREVYILRKKLLGEDNKDTIASYEVWAERIRSFGSIEQKDEVIKMMEKIYNIKKRVYGKEHIKTHYTLFNLAMTYAQNGRLSETLCKLIELCKLCDKVKNSFYSIKNTKRLIADIYIDIKRGDDAINILEELWRSEKEKRGEDDSYTLDRKKELASCLEKIGKLGAAKKEYLEIYNLIMKKENKSPSIISVDFLSDLEKKLKKLGCNNESLIIRDYLVNRYINQKNMGYYDYSFWSRYLYQNGLEDEAIVALKNELDSIKEKFRDKNRDYYNALFGYGCDLKLCQRYDQALEVFYTLYNEKVQNYGNSIESLVELECISNILRKKKEFDEALRLSNSTYVEYVKLYGEDSGEALRTQGDIAIILYEMKKYEESRFIMVNVVEKYRKYNAYRCPYILEGWEKKNEAFQRFKIDEFPVEHAFEPFIWRNNSMN